MIIRVLQMGKDGAGLARYLFGAGKANEHTNQRMIAGSPSLYGEWGNSNLTRKEASHLGRLMEANWRRQYAPELALSATGPGGVATGVGRPPEGGISRENLTEADAKVLGQKHVWHTTIAISAADGDLTDDQWNEVATTYMREMGFIDNPDHEDVTWYAVNHGRSVPIDREGNVVPGKPGNDHVHIAMCTMLRDGTTVNVHNAGIKSQKKPRQVLEQLPYISKLHDDHHQANTPTLKSYTAAEHNMARKRAAAGEGPAEPERLQLQRIVRAAATQARTEAEFINNVLSHRGVRIEAAHWQPGNRDVVTGYKVGFRDGIAFGASKLASDLTLSKLRPNWTETPETAQLARDLWAGDASKLDPLRATPDVPEQLDQAARHLADFNDHLRRLNPHDKDAWAEATSSLAGTAAVVATGQPAAFKEHGGRAADVLARIALEDKWTTSPDPAPTVPSGLSGAELATRHVQLALRAASTNKHSGWLAVIQQITRATSAIQDAKFARREYAGALALNRHAVTALSVLEHNVTTTAQPATSSGGTATVTATELSAAAQAAQKMVEHNAPTPGQRPPANKPSGTPASPGVAKPPDQENQQTRSRRR